MPLHTQREEDIKEFDERWDGCFSDASGDYCNPQVKHFISNIYIKIAEREVEMWKQYDKDYLDDEGLIKMNLKRSQEELNKLKS